MADAELGLWLLLEAKAAKEAAALSSLDSDAYTRDDVLNPGENTGILLVVDAAAE